ncbi:sulfite exporter TauE/SafE family protein [Vibrio sp. WXL103]|uniref:sulfite exporter TauE/SafE family protein n=2 Tax=unclassified Vibrio TaxID=2614977 RepID=UPI003EC60C37
MDIAQFVSQMLTTDVLMLKIALGSLFGLCLGLTGVGGGVLLIPMLQLFCGMPTVLAVGTASLISAMVKINASIVHVKAKNVSWRQVGLLFIGAVPITILVTQVVVYFNQHPVHADLTQSLISALVIIVMVGSLLSVLMNIKPKAKSRDLSEEKPVRGYKALVSGMFCGSVLGSTGVGGGVLLLPVLNNVLRLDIKKSIGSSVVLALFLSSVAAIGYAKGGQADTITAVWFVIGSFVGVPAAAWLMKRLSDKVLYLITVSVISVSLVMYLSAF